MEPSSTSVPRLFWLLLAALGLVLTMTVVPGVFTVDEDNYLVNVVALRHGRVTVPGTEGLTPSPELVWFDPLAHSRRVESTPVASTAPPLYAPIALPFSFLGWNGLAFLNVLSFLAAALVLFVWSRRFARSAATPWIAAGAFLLAGYSIEYAQGVWPHMLTVALTLTGAWLVARVRDGESWLWALLAGFTVALAAGIRYQNIVFASCVGLGLLLWAPQRLRAGAAFGLGAGLPLSVSALINHARFGSWNPISKGPGYLAMEASAVEPSFWRDAVTMFWARVVDYAQRPAPAGSSATYLSPDPETGAYVVATAVKKAWLQSSPWMLPVLLLLVLAWLPVFDLPARVRRELRAVSLMVGPVLGVFAVAGVHRTDGLSFNQRYFLELVPLMALGLALWLDRRYEPRQVRPLLLAAGAVAAGLVAAGVLWQLPGSPLRQRLLLYLPLMLAAVFAAAAFLDRRGRIASLTLGLSLGWATAVHLGDDLAASRSMRAADRLRVAHYAAAIPDGSAVFAYWGHKDAFGPLFLERDLVVVDPHADGGKTAPRLVAELLAQGRRVFVVAAMPDDVARAIRGDRPVRRVAPGVPGLISPLMEIGDPALVRPP